MVSDPASCPTQPVKPSKWWGRSVVVLTLLILYEVTWPLHYAAMVYWVHGRAGYVEQGIRVVKTHPLRFSDGQKVPYLVELVTGISTLVLAHVAAMLLVGLTYRVCTRFSPTSPSEDR